MSAVAKQNTELAQQEGNVTSVVMKQLQTLQSKQLLFLPSDYVVENALKSAYLYIQTSPQKSALEKCTPASQVNALYNMVLQGCDLAKSQGYLIPYGDVMTFQRSYFGDIAVAQRVRPGITPFFDVIYDGEAVKLVKLMTSHGYVTTIEHAQKFPRNGAKIVGAYCGFIDEHGEHMGVEVMDIDQIKKSWEKSKTYSAQSKTFHNEQPDRACLRTVIRRRCKPIISASTDAALIASIAESDMDEADAHIAKEASDHANGEILTLPIAEPEPSEPEAPEGEEVKRSAQGNVMDDQPPLGQDTPY